MGKMATVEEVHTQNGVAGFEQGGKNGGVGGRAGKWLHIDPQVVSDVSVGCEKFRGATAGECFEHINVLNAFVIAGVAVTTISAQLVAVVHDGFFVLITCFRSGITFSINVLER